VARTISLARAPRTGINRTVKLGAVLGSCAQWEIAQATPPDVSKRNLSDGAVYLGSEV